MEICLHDKVISFFCTVCEDVHQKTINYLCGFPFAASARFFEPTFGVAVFRLEQFCLVNKTSSLKAHYAARIFSDDNIALYFLSQLDTSISN